MSGPAERPGGTLGPAPLAAATAVLAAAASRPWGLGVLALVAYVPVFAALARCRSPRVGAVAAIIASLGLTSVAYEATLAISVPAYLLALLLASLPYAAVGALCGLFNGGAGRPRRSTLTLLALPGLWGTAEWLPAQERLWGAFALPLARIGYSQVDLPTLQFARLSSVTAVSAAVLWANALVLLAVLALLEQIAALRLHGQRRALALLPRPAPPRARAGLGAGGLGAGGLGGAGLGGAGLGACAGLAVLAGLTVWLSPESPAELPGPPTLLLLQPDLPDSAYLAASRWPAARAALVDGLIGLAATVSPVVPAARLTVLPEAAWPDVLDTTPPDPVAPGATPAGAAPPPGHEGLPVPLLFGAPARATVASGAPGGAATRQGATRYSNAAFLIDGGVLTHVQDKLRLVPFAESGLVAGVGPRVVDVAGVAVAVLICYDAVFPAITRRARRAGAGLVAILTDDSFAARGDVPLLHARTAVFRAVESGVAVALASNTGPSLVIASNGRVLASTARGVATALAAPLPTALRDTTYVRHGDWLGTLTAVCSLTVAAVAASRGGGAGS